jgi:predicted permease
MPERMIRRLLSRLRHLLGGRRFRRELDEEISFHLDALAHDLVRSGMDPAAARRQARIRFGSTEHVHERARAERGLAAVDELARNLRITLRRIARSPLLSMTFVLTLSLCIGFGTGVFSVADAALWRPLPYPSPERLAQAVLYNPSFGKDPRNASVDGRTWEAIRDADVPFQRAVYSGAVRGVGLSTDETADYVQQQRVGAGYFRTLGIEPLLGRELTAAEDVADGPAIVILSHHLWSRTFLGNPSILGETIRLKGEAHTVVGVMPPFISAGPSADLWTPLQPSTDGEGAGTNYGVLVRLPEGMSLEEADARLAATAISWRSPDAPERRLGLVPLDETLSAGVRLPMLIVLAAFAVMLLVGSANLAGLQIAQTLAREGETATRQALGGDTRALVRLAVVENVALAALGVIGGLTVAWLAVSGLEEVVQSRLGIWQDVRLDLRAVSAALALTAVAALVFSLAPIVQAARPGLHRVVLSGARTVGGKGHALRKTLLVAQVAMVTTLLIGAALLVRTYRYLDGLEPGFDPEGAFAVTVSMDDARYGSAEDVTRLFDESLAEIRAVPGVTSAAVTLSLPYERALNDGFRWPGSDQYLLANVVYVTPGFFSATGMPLLQGREIDDRDRAGSPTALVANQAFVDTYLEDRDVFATTIDLGLIEGASIVGIVGNVQQSAGWGRTAQPVWETPTLYVSAAQLDAAFLRLVHVWFSPSWIVRGNLDVAPQVTAALATVAPDLAIARVTTLESVVRDAFAWERAQAAFLTAVAAFTMLLALVGLYGIVAHEAQERRGEIGLRLALGASPGRSVLSVAAKGVVPTVHGVVLGVVAGLVLARLLLQPMIFGLSPQDPTTIAAVVALLLVVAGGASLLPALRTARVGPAEVMKAA